MSTVFWHFLLFSTCCPFHGNMKVHTNWKTYRHNDTLLEVTMCTKKCKCETVKLGDFPLCVLTHLFYSTLTAMYLFGIVPVNIFSHIYWWWLVQSWVYKKPFPVARTKLLKVLDKAYLHMLVFHICFEVEVHKNWPLYTFSMSASDYFSRTRAVNSARRKNIFLHRT
jgi:hypothetical protein